MGAYLSSPVTDKISTDKNCPTFTFGASSMQGWRISQEDAHNCLPDFDSESNTALFAVYDGHGGSEVAQYCSLHLPDFIKNTDQYKEGNLEQALIDAFLQFDGTLVQEDVIKELKALAGEDDNDEEEEDDDPVGRGEADELRAEADIPLDQLLAKYQTHITETIANKKCDIFQSPMVHAKRSIAGSSVENLDSEPVQNISPSSLAGASSSSTDETVSVCCVDSLTNGFADNENNLNKEKELQDGVLTDIKDKCDARAISISKITTLIDQQVSSSSSNEPSQQISLKCSDSIDEQSRAITSTIDIEKDNQHIEENSVSGCSSSLCENSLSKVPVQETLNNCSKSPGRFTNDVVDGSSSLIEDEPGSSGLSTSAGGKSDELTKIEEDFDSDDDSEDEWQDDSEEEDEEDEEDEEEDCAMESGEPMMDMSNEEPGADSGCTACVALLRKDQLVIANAGDSRCVISRAGKALDLSVDHKPEDTLERTRIEKAGGKVTGDGRVNGGLNLSRALGDHFYKRNEELPLDQQMITGLPDIRMETLLPEDEFLVLACDGIWNYLSSQEVVDFVRERLKDPEKKKKLSLICEEMFDHCLAPNTYGDGTGCDNMTCIIVVFHPCEAGIIGDSILPSKRYTGDLEEDCDDYTNKKRPRVDDSGDCKADFSEISSCSEKMS